MPEQARLTLYRARVLDVCASNTIAARCGLSSSSPANEALLGLLGHCLHVLQLFYISCDTKVDLRPIFLHCKMPFLKDLESIISL